MLGPFTDTWGDLVDDMGAPLHFGILRYHISHVSTFCERVKPRDIKAALVLLTYLFLEHHTVEDSLLFDSSMLLIKASSEGAGVHYNSFGKPNRMFAWFVIDFLSMSILFDTFIDHHSLLAPMPFKNVSLSVEHMDMLVHNQKILIKFCLGQGPSRVDKYFVNKKTGDVGTGSLDLDKLWSTSTGDVGTGCLDLGKLWSTSTCLIVSLKLASCPPLIRTRRSTSETRKNRSRGSITL